MYLIRSLIWSRRGSWKGRQRRISRCCIGHSNAASSGLVELDRGALHIYSPFSVPVPSEYLRLCHHSMAVDESCNAWRVSLSVFFDLCAKLELRMHLHHYFRHACFVSFLNSGPGGPPPYRIYIDSGTVFLCTVALGPVCPTIAPFAFLYFCVMNPLLRWMLIFVYRPKYDGGGNKWPILHDVIISTLILSQVG
jgi:hypothetical protein